MCSSSSRRVAWCRQNKPCSSSSSSSSSSCRC
jgi:hypothetical protein